MKKGLSVLLIAAALFGFYGGATSLNDVLASKDYWEEQGEKSTADMNKLEDGLNQLKDNEKAYLDGQKELADGEVKLADAEKQLADGEVKLAAGKAELAKGYADYAAAPAKLAKGEKDLAEGKAKLAAGEKTANEGLAGINTVIGYLNQVNAGFRYYSTGEDGSKGPSFKSGFQQLKDGRSLAVQTLGTAENQKLLQMIAGLVGDPTLGENFDTTSSYADFNDATVKLIKTFTSVNNTLSDNKDKVDTYVGQLQTAFDALDKVKGLADTDPIKVATFTQVAGSLESALGNVNPETELALMTKIGKTAEYQQLCDGINALKTASALDFNTCYGTLDAVIGGLSEVSTTLDAYMTKLSGTIDQLQLLADGYDQLTTNQATIYSSLKQIYGGIVSNSTLKEAFKNNAPALYNYMVAFKSGAVYGKLGTEDLQKFVDDMETITGSYDPAIIQVLNQVKVAINQELQDGRDQIAAGEAELAAGYAEYYAAPAKLADGEKQVADGEKQLADGYKQYEDGKKALEDGKKQLAQYEDGEQQVRDGLATLMATKADPGLESILDRSNGDDKFDDANGHLQLDKGLAAVDTGRGYQADSGELITKEITNRAVGTAAGLGAAALAVLAAILSFLKKSKGAAVSAVLAAVAGGIGAGVGLSAGEYYSDIAGSTIGNTPFIAAAVLAAVAAVFAIVHFTAKPEAK